MELIFYKRFIDNVRILKSEYGKQINETLNDLKNMRFGRCGTRLKKLKNRQTVWSSRFTKAGRIIWTFYKDTIDDNKKILCWDLGIDHDRINRTTIPNLNVSKDIIALDDLETFEDEKNNKLHNEVIPAFDLLTLDDFIELGISETHYYFCLLCSEDNIEKIEEKIGQENVLKLIDKQNEKQKKNIFKLFEFQDAAIDVNTWDKVPPRLRLYPKQIKLVSPDETRGPLLIHGPAGSGKTTVALHRFVYYCKYYEKSKIIYLTWNKELVEKLREEILSIICRKELPKKWEITDINTFVKNYLNRIFGISISEVKDYKWVEEKLKYAANECGLSRENRHYNSKITCEYVADEIISLIKSNFKRPNDWFKNPDFDEWYNIYRTSDRRSRQEKITDEEDFKTIFKVFKYYQTNILRPKKITDDTNLYNYLDIYDAVKLLLDHFNNKCINNLFDAVIIDEAQDLTENELLLVSQLSRIKSNILFCADPRQQRLKTNFNMNSLVYRIEELLEQKLYIIELDQNYRNTKQIYAIFKEYFKYIKMQYNIDVNITNQNHSNVYNSLPEKMLLSQRSGEIPILIETVNNRRIKDIGRNKKYELAQALAIALAIDGVETVVLLPDKSEIEERELKKFEALLNTMKKAFNKVSNEMVNNLKPPKIIHLTEAAGLEFDAAVLLDCLEIFSDSSSKEDIVNYYRKRYVALSRPREQLIIIGAAEIASNIFKDKNLCIQDYSRLTSVLNVYISKMKSRLDISTIINQFKEIADEYQEIQIYEQILNDNKNNYHNINQSLTDYLKINKISDDRKYNILFKLVNIENQYHVEVNKFAFNQLKKYFPEKSHHFVSKIIYGIVKKPKENDHYINFFNKQNNWSYFQELIKSYGKTKNLNKTKILMDLMRNKTLCPLFSDNWNTAIKTLELISYDKYKLVMKKIIDKEKNIFRDYDINQLTPALKVGIVKDFTFLHEVIVDNIINSVNDIKLIELLKSNCKGNYLNKILRTLLSKTNAKLTENLFHEISDNIKSLQPNVSALKIKDILDKIISNNIFVSFDSLGSEIVSWYQYIVDNNVFSEKWKFYLYLLKHDVSLMNVYNFVFNMELKDYNQIDFVHEDYELPPDSFFENNFLYNRIFDKKIDIKWKVIIMNFILKYAKVLSIKEFANIILNFYQFKSIDVYSQYLCNYSWNADEIIGIIEEYYYNKTPLGSYEALSFILYKVFSLYNKHYPDLTKIWTDIYFTNVSDEFFERISKDKIGFNRFDNRKRIWNFLYENYKVNECREFMNKISVACRKTLKKLYLNKLNNAIINRMIIRIEKKYQKEVSKLEKSKQKSYQEALEFPLDFANSNIPKWNLYKAMV